MLGKIAASAGRITILPTVDSTNNYAMGTVRSQALDQVQAWQALRQTAGRGRLGRHWFQQPGDGLALSIALPAHLMPATGLVGLNMMVALCTHACVEQWLRLSGLASLKWPNDMMIGDRKAGGILIETVHRAHELSHAVVGIGINLNGVAHSGDERNKAVSLQMVTGNKTLVQEAGEQLYERVLAALDTPEEMGVLLHRYKKVLYGKGEWMRFVRHDGQEIHGKCLGMDAQGRLMLQDGNGEVMRLHHHDVERKPG